MKTRILLLLLLASLLVYGYPAVQPVLAEASVQVAQPQWEQFSSREGGFTVLMPVKPIEKRQATNSENLPIEANQFTASLEEGKVTYSVSYTNFPSEFAQFPPNILLDSLSSRFTTDKRLKLLNQQDISLDRHPGKEFKLETPGETIVIYRAYLVEQRLYQLIAEIPKARETALSSETERFLGSFQLLK
jgi:hypothetical protein